MVINLGDGFKNKSDIEREIDDFLSQFDEEEFDERKFEGSGINYKEEHNKIEDQFDKISNQFDRSFRKSADSDELFRKNMAKLEAETSRPSRMQRLHGERSIETSKENFKKTSSKPAQGKNTSQQSMPLSESSAADKKGLLPRVKSYITALLMKTKILERDEDTQRSESDMRTAMSDSKKKKKKYRVNKKQLLKFILSTGLAFCILIVGVVISIIVTAPPIDPDNIYALLSENSVLYDDEGAIVDSLNQGNGLRTNVSYNQLPKDLVDAFVSIEDKTFWDHHGFNFIRIFGAIFESVTQGERISGTSTITQQLARNLFLAESKSQRSMTRKIKEAYYTICLERKLTKEQIIEAYLNTIFLGSQANGVQAASQAYFSKNVEDLTLPECATLATLPQSPNAYAPVKQDRNEILDTDGLDILRRGEEYTMWYNDAFVSRQQLVLKFMKEQGYLSQNEYQEAKDYDIRSSINPSQDNTNEISSYFADYTIKQVLKDLIEENGMKETDARNMLYNGGLRIYTTMNVKMQKIAETEFANSANFPKVVSLNKDRAGNVRDKSNRILLYNKSSYFNSDDSFTIHSDEYKRNPDGSLTLLRGKRLNFIRTEVQGNIDYSTEFKNLYVVEDNIFYNIAGGVLQIPAEYKSKDSDGNLVVDAAFIKERPMFFQSTGNGDLTISREHFSLKQKIMQPQSAMIIMDHKTGSIKAMVGGRSVEGRQIFNRSTATRQPGSAIKPMGVYAPALQSAVDGETNWTAASLIDDAPLTIQGKLWPKNWYRGYRGLTTLRESVEQSVNVNAVKVWMDIGPERSLAFLKKLGVTSVIESGSVNDMNAAALALGGMSKGISPLQMCAGYSTFANQGIYNQPACYTKVTNKKGEVILEKEVSTKQVMDPGVAFIMTDILKTTVTNGIAGRAAIGSQPVAGKTGTTTDNYDAWFVGFTPQYSASVWIGNDVNIELSQGSAAAARIWSKIMKQVHSGIPSGNFSRPDDVISIAIDIKSGKRPSQYSSMDPRNTVKNEYFVSGTEPTATDDVHVPITVCGDSGLLATPWCPNPVQKVAIKRPGGNVSGVQDADYDIPTTYCPLHNLDTTKYPVKPGSIVDPNFIPSKPSDEDDTNNSDGNSNNENGNQTDTTPSPNPPVVSSGSNNENSSKKPDWLN